MEVSEVIEIQIIMHDVFGTATEVATTKNKDRND
jgi:hypothetical protein